MILAPAVFGLYRGLALIGMPVFYRAYCLSILPGAILLLHRSATAGFLSDGQGQEDVAVIVMIVAGIFAGYTFRHSVQRFSEAAHPNQTT